MTRDFDKIYRNIALISIFLIAVGFMGFGDKIVLLLLFINCLIQSVINRKLFIDAELILLFAGMLFYGIFGRLEAVWMVKYTLLPALFYMSGASVPISQNRADCNNRAKTAVIALSLGLLIESILNALRWAPELGRYWPEFWSGRPLLATQHVFYNLLVVALFFYGLYRWNSHRLLNSILVLGGIWCLWFSLVTGSRSLVMIFAIVIITNIILYFYLNRHNETARRSLRLFAPCLLAAVIFAGALYLLNAGGIYDYLHSQTWNRDGGILHNIRFQAQISALRQIPEYPFGGSRMDLAGLGFAHNVWLDVANRSGLIPFVLLVAYTFFTLYNLIKLIRTQTTDHDIIYLLVSSYLSLFLYYMIEPALDANIMYWALWALICGLTKGVLKNHDNMIRME